MIASPRPAGLEFGPTSSGKTYLSLYAHRGNHPGKSCWANDLPPPEEYGIFETSDGGGHQDQSGHYWGTRDVRGTALGTRGERLAKFPNPANPSDPWHGYPVSPASGRAAEAPPDDLVEALILSGLVSKALGRKLQKRRA